MFCELSSVVNLVISNHVPLLLCAVESVCCQFQSDWVVKNDESALKFFTFGMTICMSDYGLRAKGRRLQRSSHGALHEGILGQRAGLRRSRTRATRAHSFGLALGFTQWHLR